MKLSLVIVNYQGLPLLKKCLESIETHLRGRLKYEVWVVDNASTDGSPEWLREHAAATPHLHVILNTANLGFARANNLALRRIAGEFVLLLNSDAFLIDDSVLAGIAFLEKNPNAFGAGGLLLNGDGTIGPSYGHFPTPATLVKELRARAFSSLRAVVPGPDHPSGPVDFPCGAYFLVNAMHLPTVGLLDEAFFLYFEETDWAHRAWKSGHPIHYLPQCRAIHLGGGSSKGPENPVIVATFYESWRLYLRKHARPPGTALVLMLLIAVHGRLALRSYVRKDGAEATRHLTHVKGIVRGFFGTPSRRLSGFVRTSTQAMRAS